MDNQISRRSHPSSVLLQAYLSHPHRDDALEWQTSFVEQTVDRYNRVDEGNDEQEPTPATFASVRTTADNAKMVALHAPILYEPAEHSR